MAEKPYTYDANQIRLAQEYMDILAANVDLQQKVADRVADTVKAKETELEFTKATAGLFEKGILQQEKIAEVEEARLKASEKALQTLYENRKITQEQFEIEAKRLMQQEKANIAFQAGLDKSKQLVKMLGGKPSKDTYAGMLLNPDANLFKFTEGLVKGTVNMGIFTKAWDLATSGLDKYVEKAISLTAEMDKANVALNRSTGLTNKFSTVLDSATHNLTRYGFSADEVSKSIAELTESNLLFTSYTEDTQNILIENNNIMGKMGYNTANLAKQQVNLTKVMKKSPEQAVKFQQGMQKLQKQLGLTSQQMQGASEASQEAMSIIGDTTGMEFSRLTQIMQKTGLGMEKLLSLSDKFNTFEGAADSVGKLNALMGGPYLNSVNMLEETDPSKRLAMISENLRAAGVTWESLGPQSRRAYAAALGLEKVTDLSLLLSDKIDLIQGQDLSLGMSPEEIEKQAKELAQYNSLMENLNAIGRSLMVTFSPVVAAIKDALSEVMQDQTFIDSLTNIGDISKSINPEGIKSMVTGIASVVKGLVPLSVTLAKIVSYVVENPITSLGAAAIVKIGGSMISSLLGGKGLFGGGGPGSSPSNPLFVQNVGDGGGGGGGSALDTITDILGTGKKKGKKGRTPGRSGPRIRDARGRFIRGAPARSGGILSNIGSRASGLLGRGGSAVSRLGTLGASAAGAGSGIIGKAGGLLAKGKGLLGKGLGKIAGKTAMKSLLKKIPGIGALAGLGFGASRLMSGDVLGALGEVGSGLASTIPGIGTAVSTAIDAGLMAKDTFGGAGETPASPAPAASSRIAQAESGKSTSALLAGGSMMAGAMLGPLGALGQSLVAGGAASGTSQPIKVVMNVDGNVFGEVVASIPFSQKFPRSTFMTDITEVNTRGANNV